MQTPKNVLGAKSLGSIRDLEAGRDSGSSRITCFSVLGTYGDDTVWPLESGQGLREDSRTHRWKPKSSLDTQPRAKL
jgi:hypothetical protein